MKECNECYSQHSRITPLRKPRECLENHLQYICGTCGRCICVNATKSSGLQRWNFPFTTLEVAKLYLRSADATEHTSCGIYEITDKNGRKSYKIFRAEADLLIFLQRNKDKTCSSLQPVYKRASYEQFPNTEIRRLHADEVERYLKEQQLSQYYVL